MSNPSATANVPWGIPLKVADPRMTAGIPGTTDPAHMLDNAGAMRGTLPDPDQCRRMVQFVSGAVGSPDPQGLENWLR